MGFKYIQAIREVQEQIRELTEQPCNLLTAKRLIDMARMWGDIEIILHPHNPIWPQGYYYNDARLPKISVSVEVQVISRSYYNPTDNLYEVEVKEAK